MKLFLGLGVTVAAAIAVYFLHVILEGDAIPMVLLLISAFVTAVDFPRRNFYVVGLAIYPIFTAIEVAWSRTESLFPIIIFYELLMVAMILLGAFLGNKFKHAFDGRKDKDTDSSN